MDRAQIIDLLGRERGESIVGRGLQEGVMIELFTTPEGETWTLLVTFLIVEDEPVMAALLDVTLVGEGYDVVGPTNTCNMALSLVESRSVDAAVLDYMLCDGTTVTLAWTLNRRGIPFVLLSRVDRKTAETTLTLGTKLFEKCHLQDALRALQDMLVDSVR